jgi:sialate O-acetylesterase
MQRLTKVPQGLISCAHGGSAMVQWDPKLKRLGGNSLYGAMIRRFIVNGGNVAGMIWYQGCSDTSREHHAHYTRRMKEFFRVVRRDFNNQRMPVAMVQIARVSYCDDTGDDPFRYWNSIQEQQRLLPEVVDRLTVVPAIDLDLDDSIHVGGKSQNRLGKRIAHAALVQKSGRRAGKAPIEPLSARCKVDKVNQFRVIEVTFANVEGSLRSSGKPAGFSLVHHDHTECRRIYAIEVKGSKVIVKTSIPATENHDVCLYYGFGGNPYCNITDAADRSLPVFGPWLLAFEP